MSDEVKLTRRAKEVAGLVGLGLTNREIASRLFLSVRTVEWHLEQIMNKLGFSSRSQIAAWIGRSQVDTAVATPGSRSRGNLPAQFTTFIGRETELRNLLDLVSAHRMVTVVGAGGIGKTRLALRLAEELQPEFAQGVWFCDLAPVANPDLVADALAQALGVTQPASSRLEAVRDHLRDKDALLFIDNCEHVQVSSRAIARELLAACPKMRLLATSRAPLGLIGEAICQLEPMRQDEAVDLFNDRARASVPNFHIDGDNTETIGAICRRLDGVPLAIELVVPRLRVQSPAELADEVLNPAWQPLSDERHGSLYALAAWSYRLLGSAAQSLFRRLGTFSDWFDTQDVAAICPGVQDVPVLLAALAEQSMLVQDQTSKVTRYRLLEILRSFALQQLEEADELAAARLEHAEYMVRMVERVDLLGLAGGADLRPKVALMVADVRAALTTLVPVRPRRAAWLYAAVMPTWRYEGRAREGMDWGERVLAAASAPSPERCWALFQLAGTLAEIGLTAQAEHRLNEAEAFVDSPGNQQLRGQTLIVRAFCHDTLGDFLGAVKVRQEAIDVYGARGEEVMLALALNHNAMSVLFADRPGEAAKFAQRSVEIRRRVDPSRLAYTLDTLAQAYFLLGQLDDARTCWLEAADLDLTSGLGSCVPDILRGLSMVAALRGDPEVALRCHFVAERLRIDVNAPSELAFEKRYEELMTRLLAEIGPEESLRLRSEAGALEPKMAFELVNK